MADQRATIETVLFSGQAADGWSASFPIPDNLWTAIVISTANSADGDIKVAGSHLSGDNVDFTSAAAVGNEWAYIALYNEEDPSSVIAGSTGAQYTGTDGVRHMYINTSQRKTIAVELDNYVAGNFTVTLIGATNQ